MLSEQNPHMRTPPNYLNPTCDSVSWSIWGKTTIVVGVPVNIQHHLTVKTGLGFFTFLGSLRYLAAREGARRCISSAARASSSGHSRHVRLLMIQLIITYDAYDCFNDVSIECHVAYGPVVIAESQILVERSLQLFQWSQTFGEGKFCARSPRAVLSPRAVASPRVAPVPFVAGATAGSERATSMASQI